MLRRACLVVAICLLSAACDSDVVPVPDDWDEPAPAGPEARVDDCVRAGGGVPIARVRGGDPLSLASDGASLFYMSDGRVLALPLAAGAARPLTAKRLGGRDVQYASGFVYWAHDDTVYRVASSGGEPEALVELASGAKWVVAGDAILSGGLPSDPSPLFRSSLTTGETTEILPPHEGQPIRSLRVAGDRVLVESGQRLLSMSVFGGDERLVDDDAPSAWDPPIDESDAELVESGLPASMVVDDDTNLYWIDECTDAVPSERRLVAAPKLR